MCVCLYVCVCLCLCVCLCALLLLSIHHCTCGSSNGVAPSRARTFGSSGVCATHVSLPPARVAECGRRKNCPLQSQEQQWKGSAQHNKGRHPRRCECMRVVHVSPSAQMCVCVCVHVCMCTCTSCVCSRQPSSPSPPPKVATAATAVSMQTCVL